MTKVIAATTLFLLLEVGPASATIDGTPLFGNVGDGGPAALPTGTLGYGLTIGTSPLTMTHLGIWDHGGDGLAASHDVGVWDLNTQTLLDSVTVPAGTTAEFQDAYRYVTLTTPLVLSANTAYVVGAAYGSHDDLYRWFDAFGISPIVTPGLTLEWGRAADTDTSALAFPFLTTSAHYSGPNAIFIPEPASVALLALGLCAIPRRGRQ